MTTREKELKVVALIFFVLMNVLSGVIGYQASVIEKQKQLIKKMYNDCPLSPSNPTEKP